MKATTLDPLAPGNPRLQFSTRPSFLVRVAPLGRLDGIESTLLGVMQDALAEAGESGIDYGIGEAGDISRIEVALGSPLEKLMENGDTIQSFVSVAPRRLRWLQRIPDNLSARYSLPVFPELWRDETKWPRNNSNHFQYAEAHERQQQQREDFERRRALAMKLRGTWSFSELKHKSDFVSWIPSWVREICVESSRPWLALPATPSTPAAALA